MSDSRHAKVRDLFLEACELPATERGDFLDRACGGDGELRSEVASLLTHHDTHDSDTRTVASGATHPGARPRTRYDAGHVFAGRYRIVSALGRGGMGDVFRADDLMLDEPVAIKMLPHKARRYHEFLRNEVRMARQVTHENVCRVFDFGEADGETYLTMEYVDGEDLGSLLGRIGRLQQDKLLDVARQLASGLAAAHAKGVLHRDLKPANVMIDGRGQVRLTDFGIATVTAPDGTPGDKWAVGGTPAYMPPEQAAGEPPSVSSDIYSLGLVLYEMATGKAAFEATTPADYADQHRKTNPTPPSRHVSHLDSRLEALILQCLEKDPSRRPTSAREILAALPGGDQLQLAIDAGETPSPEVVATGRQQLLSARWTAVSIVTLAVLLGLVLGLGDRAYPDRAHWQDRPPDVLAERAATILRSLGYSEKPVDRAWGFLPYGDEGLFWYRQSTDHLVPSHLAVISVPRVDFFDPPPLDSGMSRLLLEADGRLSLLHIVPEYEEPEDELSEDDEGDGDTSSLAAVEEEVEETGARAGDANSESQTAVTDAVEPFEWKSVLEIAGYGAIPLERQTPSLTPPTFADQRAAWSTRDGRLKIEAAAYRGQLVFFDATPSEEDKPSESWFDFEKLWSWYIGLSEVVWLLLAGAAIALAWIHLRAGRGDLQGARTLATFVIIVQTLVWLLGADHVPLLPEEIFRFQANLGRILLEAALAWLAYIALEPTVRRWWPRALIGWTRLLRGKFRDPLVGRDLLIGSVAGTFWALATQLDRLGTRWLALENAGELFAIPQIEVALKGRYLLASILADLVAAAQWAVLGLFFLVVLRIVVRRWWLAIVLFVLVDGLLETLEGIHPAVSWLTLGVGIAAVTAWVLVRFGLLTYAAALFCYYILVLAPVTSSFDAWFAEAGLFVLALVAGLGAYGAWNVLAEQPRLELRLESHVFGEPT